MTSLQRTNAIVNDENAINHALKPEKHQQPKRRAALVDISNKAQKAVSRKHNGKAVRVPKTQDIEAMILDDVEEILLPDVTEVVEQPKVTEVDSAPLSLLISSIDIDDMDDPQLVAEYVEDIFRHYFEVESVHSASSTYMEWQKDIRPDMRRVLIDWLVEVHSMFNLKPETLFLTVNILDRYCSIKQVPRSHLQLLGSTALWVASKYEEMYAPEIEDFVYVSDKAFTRKDMIYSEGVLCMDLEFVFSCPTPFHFAQRFAKVAALNERNLNFMWYLLELSMLDFGLVRYPPSMIAASAVYLTTYFDATSWTDELIEHTRYSYSSIRPCVKEIYAILASGKPSSVRKKYSSRIRMRVAQIGQEVVDSQIRDQAAQAQQEAHKQYQ